MIFFTKKVLFVGLIWFALVSLFNDISTFVGYLMPKLYFYRTAVVGGGIREFMPFLSILWIYVST